MGEPASAADDSGANADHGSPRWRRILVSALVIVGVVLTPIAIHSVWIHNTLLNTDQYVATVGPLASNPAIQNGLANRVTNELVDPAAIQQQVKGTLPPRVSSFLAPFVANGVQQLAHRVALRVVQSSKFATLWESLNRRVHSQLVALLKGQGRFVKNGEVVVDLGPVKDKVAAALKKVGITGLAGRVSQANSQLVLLRSPALKDAQGGVRLLDALVVGLPILIVVLFGAAFALSTRRRRTILHAALGVAVVVGLFLIAYRLLRTVYVNALPASVDSAAAGAVYDQLLSFLRLALRTVFAVALLTALGAWLAGPGSVATWIRTRARGLVQRAPGTTLVRPSIASFVSRNRNSFRVGVIAVGLVVLVFLSAPGPWTVLAIALLVLLALAVIELLQRAAAAPEQQPQNVT